MTGINTVTRTRSSDDALNAEIDEAYRSKYPGSRYLNPMIGVRPRSATVSILPRENAESEE